MEYFAMAGSEVLVIGDISAVVGGVSKTYTQDGGTNFMDCKNTHPSMSVSISSLLLLPGMSHHKSSIYLDIHPPTFPPYYSSLVRERQMTPTFIKVYLESEMNFKKLLGRFWTWACSSLLFQVRTLSPEGIWINSNLVGFPILCLSRQDMALVDFITVIQIINCQDWLAWGSMSECVCLV